MFQNLKTSNISKLQVSEFILMGFPGIHSWQHWLSLPLALLFLLALSANILILSVISQEPALHQPMYYLLSILAVVNLGLASTVMHRILAILWFNAKAISLPECFLQMYIIHCFMAMESGVLACMAIDRYVAICPPLHYLSLISESFVVKATVFMALRGTLTAFPVPVLAAQRHYCSQNQIEHCLCSNFAVTNLSCDDRTINRIYQLFLAWTILICDLGLTIVSYALIFYSVLKLNSAEATSKAITTCTSHLILILFYYTSVIILPISNYAAVTVPAIPVLLTILEIVVPPALNPMVYALKNKELQQALYKLLKLHINRN